MAFAAGTTSFVLLDNTAGSLTNLSAYADNFQWPQSVAQLDVSAFGTAAKALIPGLTDGDTVTMSGPLDATLHTHLTALKAAQSAGSTTCTITWGPAGSIATRPKVSAEAYVASYGITVGVGGRVEYTASLQVTGAVTNSVW